MGKHAQCNGLPTPQVLLDPATSAEYLPGLGAWLPEEAAVVVPQCPRCGHDGFKLESKKGYMCSRSFLCGHTWEDTP